MSYPVVNVRSNCSKLVLCLALLAACFTPAACSREPVSKRAMAAYNAKDYKTALPLLRQWAKEVHADQKQFTIVMGYIVDAEMKTTGKIAETDSTPPAPATLPAPTTMAATTTQPAGPMLMSQLEPLDPTTNKPRIHHTPIQPGEVRTMTIKQLGNFPFDPNRDDEVPADVHALNGAKVRLRGFILPWNQASRITNFALVPSLTGCCFGQPPGVQHDIECRLPKERAMEYTLDEYSVEGILKVNIKREDGYTYSIFELDVTGAKPIE